MSPTEDYQRGCFADALGWWGAQLAAGRAWSDVEAEILQCCEGRADRLTRLLIEAETVRAAARPARCVPRPPGVGTTYAGTAGTAGS